MMQLEILDGRTRKLLHVIDVENNDSIQIIKEKVQRLDKKLYPDRQALRLEPKGKTLNDNDVVSKLKFVQPGQLYLRDLGPQIGWKTVFLLEYFGPFVIYFVFYFRPGFIYSYDAALKPMPFVMHLSCLCYTSHFAKRLFETLFVHRFSHATMPLRNVFKNCGYYWLFAAFIAYFNNHPLYTVASSGNVQIGLGLFGFIFCQLGNLSVHLAFMKMRPAGTKQRKVPMPNANPFTKLFSLVSCPNYTYEVGAWLSYSIMTQSLPALLFTIAGFYQMTIWAIGKHKNYRKEFPNYPKNRKSIIPFVI